jgi:hypothetical protein
MSMRIVCAGLLVAALIGIGGCTTSQSRYRGCCAQPGVVAATPAPGCANPPPGAIPPGPGVGH